MSIKIAGIGRGAAGFTTRSDIGPARPAPISINPEENKPAETAKPAPTPEGEGKDESIEEISDAYFDPWSGYSSNKSMFSGASYDDEDKEADRIWEMIDDRQDSKRKKQREKKENEKIEKFRAARPKIATTFADAKRKLSEVSMDEWEALQEVGDYTVKKRKLEQKTPVPDRILIDSASLAAASSSQASSSSTFLFPAPKAATSSSSSLLTSTSGASATAAALAEKSRTGFLTDQRALGEARESVIKTKLNKLEDSVSGKSVVDFQGYMTGLNTMLNIGDTEVDDLKKARELLTSMRYSNPDKPASWIASARVEELAGRVTAARSIIDQACEALPQSEDLWLESSRLQTPVAAKKILAEAVKFLPYSVKIWLRAAELEKIARNKKNVLKKAIKLVPQSEELWKALIELEENEDDAKTLLAKATECIPTGVDFWLTLARLEIYDNAKKVLNKARIANPTESMIWVVAAQLEETQKLKTLREKLRAKAQELENQEEQEVKIEKTEENQNIINDRQKQREFIINQMKETEVKEIEKWLQNFVQKAIKILQKNNVPIKRRQWLRYAFSCEEGRFSLVCKSIVFNVLALDLSNPTSDDQSMNEQQKIEQVQQQGDEEYQKKQQKDEKNKQKSKEKMYSWFDEASFAQSNYDYEKDKPFAAPHFKTASNIYEFATIQFPDSVEAWKRRTGHEKYIASSTRNFEKVKDVFLKALEAIIPTRSPSLWKNGIRFFWLEQNDVETGRELLERVFQDNYKSEEYWNLAIELEMSLGKENEEKIRNLLNNARECLPFSLKIWKKSIIFERNLKNFQKCAEILQESIKRFNSNSEIDIFWLIEGEIDEIIEKNQEKAIATYEKAISSSILCLNSVSIWKSLLTAFEKQLLSNVNNFINTTFNTSSNSSNSSTIENIQFNIAKIKTQTERARKVLPKESEIWLHSLRIEARILNFLNKILKKFEKTSKNSSENETNLINSLIANEKTVLQSLLSKAQQACPFSGKIWAESIELEALPKQKARALLALKATVTYIKRIDKYSLNFDEKEGENAENSEKKSDSMSASSKKKKENEETILGEKDPFILSAVGRLFWRENSILETRDWFQRAINQDKDLGDTWIQYYAFEKQQLQIFKQNLENYGKKNDEKTNDLEKKQLEQKVLEQENQLKMIERDCLDSNPRHGELWCSFSKNWLEFGIIKPSTKEILERGAKNFLDAKQPKLPFYVLLTPKI